MPSQRTYLDHAASAPLNPDAREAMNSALDAFGNPSSQHEEGRRAKDLLEAARGRVAAGLGSRPREIVFTANGTFASQLALRGVANARKTVSRRVVLTAIEHPAVGDAADALANEGFDVVRVKPTAAGTIEAPVFLDAVGEDAACAAMMLVNHETGMRLPVAQVAASLRARRIPLVCDACLGPGRVPSTDAAVPADVVIHSAHKWGGPGGVGFLRVRRGIRIAPSLGGGTQEEGLHPGTPNVVGIVGAAAAFRAVLEDTGQPARMAAAVEAFLQPLDRVDGWRRVGATEHAAPGIVTIELDGIEGEAAMINLDLVGVGVATGSTCALGAAEPSATLLAMGMSRQRAASTLRISVGADTSKVDAAHAGGMLREVITRLRMLGRP